MSEHMNLARLKKESDHFEIVVDPEKALAWRKTQEGDVADVLKAEQIFSDAKKGELASEQRMQALFNTTDVKEVAKAILLKGEIQLTQEYRKGLMDQKRKRIVQLIHQQGVDPRTHAPHPADRIETAIDEAKVRIDEFKRAEEQIQDILKALQPIIPIKLERKEIELKIPAQHAAKSFHTIKSFGKIKSESWGNDGSWTGVIEIPGGMEQELYDKLNSLTHGEVQAKVVKVI